MKSSVVPAQITTIEDKIAGNLVLMQLVLLAAPVFIDFLLYAILPRRLHLNAAKDILMTLMALTSWLLALRVKGKIILSWAIVIARYNSRARYYVFDKNCQNHRLSHKDISPDESEDRLAEKLNVSRKVKRSESSLSFEELVKFEDLLSSPKTSLRFVRNKKGGLHARLTEVE